MAGQRIVAPGRVDDDEIGTVRLLLDQRLESLLVHIGDRMAGSARQLDAALLRRFRAIFEIAVHCPLPVVEIEGDDFGPAIGQRHGDVDCGGRFAGAAFLVGEHDTMGRGGHGNTRKN